MKASRSKVVKPPGKAGGLPEITRFLLIVFVSAVILRSFIAAPFVIPSGSMLPRMMIGDYLFVAKWSYGFSRYSVPFGLGSFEGRYFGGRPERGDVAVFREPTGTDDDYVKRVIGLPGDVVQMRDGMLVLNGRTVPKTRVADYRMKLTPNSPCRSVDPDAKRTVRDQDGQLYCVYPRFRETLPGGRSYYIIDQLDGIADNIAPLRVPARHYFMMGDNRDDSMDSRFPQQAGGVGFLPEDYLIGEALVTFFSTDGSAEWLKPWTWVSAARWERGGETF
jgi:signal peptidase I